MSALRKLEALLPPVDVPSPPAAAVRATGPLPALPRHLERMLAEPPGPDRSGQTHALVAAALEWGLDDGQVHQLADQHPASQDKYGKRLEREVDRALGKLRPDHPHPGRPCDRAGCANRPRWMTGEASAQGAVTTRSPNDPVLPGRSDADKPAAEESTPAPSSWRPVDLGPYLDGSYQPPAPSLLRRQDGRALLYGGRVHWVSGEPEAGKTWLALLGCAQTLLHGGQVVYIDLEDGPGGMSARLIDLSVPATVIRERFHYFNPGTRLTYGDRAALAPLVADVALVVIDACTESLAQQGLSSKDDTDIASWLDLLPRWAAKLGPAVVVLDHVVKDADSRGRWATGSQHKLSGLDGAAYSLETVHPAGRGLRGRSRLYVTKDRHGQVRGPATIPSSGGKHWAGDLVVDSSDVLDVVLHAPAEQEGPFRPTVLMQRISEALADAGKPLSGRDVEDRVRGKAQPIRQALAALVDDGHVLVEPGSHNSKQHRLVRPYPDPQESA